MTGIELYWHEAEESWDLCRLYQDLASIKNRSLTELQKAKLRGALCNIGLKDLARQLGRGLKGLRTDLSKGLYRFIESLLLIKGIEYDLGICWQQIPRLLDMAGYKFQAISSGQKALESISKIEGNSIRAIEIIKAIEEQQLFNRTQGHKDIFPIDVAKTLDEKGDQFYNENNLNSAIQFYRIPIEKDLTYTPFLVKIAMCFDKLHQYSDAVAIALTSIKLVTEEDLVSKLNGVLGSAFHELAIHTRDELILGQALGYYQKTCIRSTGPNVLGLWNSFDLLRIFSEFKPNESEKYLRKAKIAFYDFKDLIQDPKSNFKRYQKTILKDMGSILSTLDDKWLKIELVKLKNI